jgi:hypothetical protein
MRYRMAIVSWVCCLWVLSAPASSDAPPAARDTEIRVSGERRIGLNQGWRFLKGEAEGAEQPDFADAGWRTLDLPHDWAIEGPFDRKYNPHCGGLPFYGVGWYRKHFTLPADAQGKYYAIEFDGAMSNSRVWLNGQELGGRPYGYIGFAFDLTPYRYLTAIVTENGIVQPPFAKNLPRLAQRQP